MEANGYKVVKRSNKASKLFFFGCAFNEHNENMSWEKLMETAEGFDEIFVLEGIADIKENELNNLSFMDKHKIIKCRDFEKLDRFFCKSVPYKNFSEVNQPFIQESEQGNVPRKGHNKFYIQVGHGCNDQCTYCGDKLIIGEIKSKPIENVLFEVKKGLNSGYSDIELIGDDLGAYGIDIETSIAELLETIISIDQHFNLYLHEMNIRYLIPYIDKIDDILKSNKVKSMVLAFQSGSTRILKLMGRKYTREDALSVFTSLRKHKNVAKRFHAIIGFPTETDLDFQDTLSIIEQSDFASGSLFIYQDRRYSKAYHIQPKIPVSEVEHRVNYGIQELEKMKFRCNRLPDKIMVFKEK